MYPITAGELVSFTPAEYSESALAKAEERGEDVSPFSSPPVYHIKVPDISDRARLMREVTALGATYPSDYELKEALLASVNEIIDEDQRPELIELIELVAEGSPHLTKDDQLKYREFERQIRGFSPEYSRLLADRVYFNQIQPIAACRLFLAAVENTKLPLKKERGLVSDGFLKSLPHSHVSQIGWKAISLMTVTPDLEKNSASPSS